MKLIVLSFLCVVFAFSIAGQTTKKPVKKTSRPGPATQTPTPEPTPEQTEPAKIPGKKNERPGATVVQQTMPAYKPNYFYEFSQPNFNISKLTIEHDEAGIGKITLMKSDWTEPDSDPIVVSPAALERIRAAFEALDFLNSTDSYQYEKDYQHLGNHKFKLVRGGKERETVFNWTVDKNAKVLMDEYRKLGNQYTWIFDMNVARQNQPLNAPGQMDLAERFIERNEFSDPIQLTAYLKEVSLDERIPLIARNHATRLIERIEKDRDR